MKHKRKNKNLRHQEELSQCSISSRMKMHLFVINYNSSTFSLLKVNLNKISLNFSSLKEFYETAYITLN